MDETKSGPNPESNPEAESKLREASELGQFIPLHYHYNMLQDTERMERFKRAINELVNPGDTVLELGGGTGVLSFFAAQKAARVLTVEYNIELLNEAKRILALNKNGDRVRLIHADAAEFVPDEPVDVVVCEMLHVALLREKQTEVISRFKANYAKRHGARLPFFIPCATFNAVQPVQHDFEFSGYNAPVLLFQDPYAAHERTVELGGPAVYSQLMYHEPYGSGASFDGRLQIVRTGRLNAVRVITKSVLSLSQGSDWHSQYMVVPLAQPLDVEAGQEIDAAFSYEYGAALSAMKPSVKICAK